MMKDDPTEAINSDKIIPLTYDIFTVIYHSKSGGAVAYELLTHNNKLYNVDINERKQVVTYIMDKDLQYMENTTESFFHFIIANNNKTIQDIKPILNTHLQNMNTREKLADYTYGHYSYNVLDLQDTIYCSDKNSFAQSMFVHGFSAIEQTGRWSSNECSIIRFKINNTIINETNKLVISVNSLPNSNQQVTISVNEVDTIQTFIEGDLILQIPLCFNVKYPNEIIVCFKYANVKTPKELNINNDTRKLALFFKWIKLI